MKYLKYFLIYSVVFFIFILKANALEDGVYKIESELGKIVEYGGALTLGSNVRINEFKNLDSQKWIVKKIDDYYVISSLSNSDYYLDVFGALSNNGTNVHMWKGNGTKAQKWKIEEDGVFYNVISLCNDLYLDVFGALSNNGTNIHMWKGNGTKAQRFKFVKIDEGNIIENGNYYLESVFIDNYIIGVSNGVVSGVKNDLGFLNSFNVKNKNGKFLVKNGDKFLGVSGDRIALCDDEFLWDFVDNYDGSYSLAYDGRYFDFDLFLLTNRSERSSQKFKFIKVDTSIIEDGVYTFSNRGFYLSFAGGLPVNGRNVFLGNECKWNVKRISDNIYEISSVIDDNYVLDVSAAGIINGTNIQVFERNGTKAQRFRIIKNGDSYNIISLLGGCVDIASGNIAKGTNIWFWKINGTESQCFKIEKSDYTFEKVIEDGKYIMETSVNLNKSIKFYSRPYIYDLFGNSSDIVNIKHDGKGFYTLENNGLYLTDDGDVTMRSYAGSERQLWFIFKSGEYYSLCSKFSGNFIDVPGADGSNGIRLHTFEANGTSAQKYKLEKVSDDMLEDGFYNIKINDSFLGYDSISNGSKIRSGVAGKWYFKNLGDNIYEIKVGSFLSKVMDVTGGGTSNGTAVQLYTHNSTDSQKFRLIKLADGVKFVSERSHSVLTMDDFLKIYDNYKKDNQVFNLTKTDGEVYDKPIESGYYVIKSGNNVLDDTMSLVDINSKVSQIWKFNYIGNGLYNIVSALNPKRYLTYDGKLLLDGYNDSENQMWKVRILEDGEVYISNYSGFELNKLFDSNFYLLSYTDVKMYEGIDISKWQGNIDFGKLSLEKPDFIIMRLGYGEKDDRFDHYYAEARRYNIPIGVYTHSKALSVADAYLDAEKTIRWLDERKIDLPIFYDIEDDNQIGLGKDVLTRIVSTFCDRIMDYNYICGVYANKWWLNDYLNAYELSLKYPIWMAHYTGARNYDDAINHFSDYDASSYSFWQFTNQGILNGITENTVDLDFGFDIYD